MTMTADACAVEMQADAAHQCWLLTMCLHRLLMATAVAAAAAAYWSSQRAFDLVVTCQKLARCLFWLLKGTSPIVDCMLLLLVYNHNLQLVRCVAQRQLLTALPGAESFGWCSASGIVQGSRGAASASKVCGLQAVQLPHVQLGPTKEPGHGSLT